MPEAIKLSKIPQLHLNLSLLFIFESTGDTNSISPIILVTKCERLAPIKTHDHVTKLKRSQLTQNLLLSNLSGDLKTREWLPHINHYDYYHLAL